MRLEELEVIRYSLPFREPYVTARGELRERDLVLVRIRGEGLEGLGETAALSLRGGPGTAQIAREIEEHLLAGAASRRLRTRADLVGARALPQPRSARRRRWPRLTSPCTTSRRRRRATPSGASSGRSPHAR